MMKRIRFCTLILAFVMLLSACGPSLTEPLSTEADYKEETEQSQEQATEEDQKNQSKEEEKETVEDKRNPFAKPDPSLDDEFNIMMIGNSNCYYWTDELYGILDKAGYQNVNVCNIYYSGCTFDKHWKWLQNDEANYQFFTVNSRGRNGQQNVSLKTALNYKNWDAFFLVAGNSKLVYSGQEDEYEKSLRDYLPLVVNYIRERFPHAEYYWQQIWAQGIGKTATSVEVQKKGAQNFKEVSLRITKDYNLINVPQGDAWQAVRYDPLITEGGTKTLNTRIFQGKPDHDDQIHDGDVGGGQYLNACVFFEVLTKKSCVGTFFRPEYTYNGKDMSLSEEKINLLQKAAHEAVAKAYGENFAQ